MAWKMHFSNLGIDEDRERWRRLRSRRPITPECPTTLPQRVQAFLHDARDRFQFACMRHRASKAPYSTDPLICRMALRMLKESSTGTIPTDKDFGWSLISKADYLKLEQDVLSSDFYVREHWTQEKSGELLEAYVLAARWIGQHVDPSLMGALLSDMGSHDRVFQRLLLTLKTHKPNGAVSARAIHSSTGHPLRPGHRFIASMLKPFLRRIPYLFSSTGSFLAAIQKTPIPSTARFFKLDVKDFYMSGAHHALVSECEKNVEGDILFKKGFSKLLRAILSSQAIRLTKDSAGPFVWRVVRGSGMGVLCSSDVSNTTFHHQVEEAENRKLLLRSKKQSSLGDHFCG